MSLYILERFFNMPENFDTNKFNANYNFFGFDGKINLKSDDKNAQKVFDKILSLFDKNNNRLLDAEEIQTIWQNIIPTDKNKDGIFTEAELTNNANSKNILLKLSMKPDKFIWFLKILCNTIENSFSKNKNKIKKKLLDNFNKEYPVAKYNITVEKNSIVVQKKGKNIPTLVCYIETDGSYNINKDFIDKYTCNSMYRYDKNGKLQESTRSIDKGEYKESVRKNEISKAIYEDIIAKNKVGLPTTGKNIEKHIKQITSKNVCEILNDYQRNYGESLLEAIEGEYGLSKDIKKRLKQHLNSCVKWSWEWNYSKPDTKINGEFGQGDIGDCWLLATVAAAAAKPKGLTILNNTIKLLPNGNYSVKFKGADKAYVVTPLEIFSASNGVSGDSTVRILEIAANKHFNIMGINGGNPGDALDLLLGTSEKWKNASRFFNPVNDNTDKLKSIIKSPDYIVTSSVTFISRIGFDDNKDYAKNIAYQHAYAVVDIDDNYVYLKNPLRVQSPSKNRDNATFKIPIEDFKKYLENIEYVKI